MRAQLSAIHRYPVKSLQGESLPEAELEPWGLAGDRRWMVVGDDGEAITAREVNAMLLLRPRLSPEGLVVRADGRPDLQVARPSGRSTLVSVFGDPLSAVRVPAATGWLTEVLGRSAHLMYLADPSTRTVDPAYGEPDDRVSFADGFPLLVTTEESLDALNDWIAIGPQADQAPLPMSRFRPNLVVSGAPAWSEDGWRRLQIGAAEFRAVKGCERCVLTTVDPDTAARGKEPIATLARHRRWGGKTWFGMNLIPDTPAGATLHVGDGVEIIGAVDAPDGPPR